MDFDSLPSDQAAQAPQEQPQTQPQAQTQQLPSFDQMPDQAQGQQQGQSLPDFDSLPDDSDKYSTPGQQAIAGLEGVAEGIAGPLAPYAEKHLLGVNPADIAGRAAANPWTHGIGQTAGLVGGAFTGTGEGALLAKAGEAAAGVAGLAKAETVGAKLAQGAVKAATEMGLFQAGDEVTKAILDDPNQTMGSVASDIGLAALMGGVTGPVFTGAGIGIKKILNSSNLGDLVDRLAQRSSGVDPKSKMIDELKNAYSTSENIGSEVGGVDGIKAQAVQNLMPTDDASMDAMRKQGKTLLESLQSISQSRARVNGLSQNIQKLTDLVNPEIDTVTNQPKTPFDPNEYWETANNIKRQLADLSKFNSPNLTYSQRAALNQFRSVGSQFRSALEDSNVWGKVGDLQKSLNSAYTDLIPATKDIESKFMSKITGSPEVDPAKFQTYINTSAKSTEATTRQKMMGNFLDAFDNFQNATSKAYDAAGVENPFNPVATPELKYSINQPSAGASMADFLYDKLHGNAIGSTVGTLAGGAAGHAFGDTFFGAVLGKSVLGPVFTSLLKPLVEKFPSINANAFHESIGMAKSIIDGNTALTKAAKNIFIPGVSAISSNMHPTDASLDKLDKTAQGYNENISGMIENKGKFGEYLPGHAVAAGAVIGRASQLINSQRPMTTKSLPLDTDAKPEKGQDAAFRRTLSVAQQPLVAMDHIKNGTLLPQDVKTIQSIYPEFKQKMDQHIMQSLAEHVSKGGTVPYPTRQAMSLFLGHPLDSTMTPGSIQTAQAVFAAQQAQKQQAMAAQKPKKNTSKLDKVSQSHMTDSQASTARQLNS